MVGPQIAAPLGAALQFQVRQIEAPQGAAYRCCAPLHCLVSFRNGAIRLARACWTSWLASQVRPGLPDLRLLANCFSECIRFAGLFGFLRNILFAGKPTYRQNAYTLRTTWFLKRHAVCRQVVLPAKGAFHEKIRTFSQQVRFAGKSICRQTSHFLRTDGVHKNHTVCRQVHLPAKGVSLKNHKCPAKRMFSEKQCVSPSGPAIIMLFEKQCDFCSSM